MGKISTLCKNARSNLVQKFTINVLNDHLNQAWYDSAIEAAHLLIGHMLDISAAPSDEPSYTKRSSINFKN